MVVNVSAETAFDLVHHGRIALIDVRDAHEFDGEHVPGARLIPLARLRTDPRALEDIEEAVFVCAAGTRSQAAARLALTRGLRRVYNVSTGLRGWKRAGYPTRATPHAKAG